jgi:cation:H+ antiporter
VSSVLAIVGFLVSLAITLLAASVFANRLDHLGHRLGMPEALLGLLTAWAADAPELSSAIVALVEGAHDVGVGVVVGSNAFNLAAMVGASALVTGAVSLRREALVLEGAVAVGALVIAGAVILDRLPPAAGVVLLALLLGPYFAILVVGPHELDRFPLPARTTRLLKRTLGETHREPPARHPAEETWAPLLLTVPALGAIIGGSTGMVRSALFLADRWGVPRVLVGTLVLSILTSLPNAYTGMRLGLAGRGTALISETLNSNTINLVGGAAVPAVFVGLSSLSGSVVFEVLWLLGMTVVSLALLGRRGGAGRAGGAVILALYAVFVAVETLRA